MRLSEATRAHLPGDVAQAGYARGEQARGIVHLGIGAFHRAHQAVYTDDAMAAGDRDWAITGVSLRSAAVHEQLAPQDGLYTVATRDAGGERLRLIEAVRAVLVAPHASDAVRAALAAPATRIVTLTVTEKGYHRLPGGGIDTPSVAGAVVGAGGTIYHYLSQAVRDRHAAGAGPMTLVSCDNMTDNGHVLRDGVAALLDGAALAWFERDWACPSTMVDRIVPATAPDDLDRVAARTGVRDEGAVMTEPFRQWVIEDRFAAGRPRWDAGGAQFVADVRPYENAKLRMLNGAHSALAYLGLGAGHDFVHQAVADPAIRAVVERLMRREAAASLDAAPGQDLAGYADALLARFANPALAHRLAQIAMDGSQKVGPRWLAALADNRARGNDRTATLTALAAWLRHLRGQAGPVNDPMGDELAALWQGKDARAMVDAMFGAGGRFAARWQADEDERATLVAVLERG